MTPVNFDKTVNNYSSLAPSPTKLPGIENHVWRAINIQRYDQPRNRLEEWLMQIFAPSHQWAAMAAALMIGIFSAYFSAAAIEPNKNVTGASAGCF